MPRAGNTSVTAVIQFFFTYLVFSGAIKNSARKWTTKTTKGYSSPR